MDTETLTRAALILGFLLMAGLSVAFTITGCSMVQHRPRMVWRALPVFVLAVLAAMAACVVVTL